MYGEIRLLTLSIRGAALPVGRVCLVSSRGGVCTVLLYVRVVDRFFSKARLWSYIDVWNISSTSE